MLLFQQRLFPNPMSQSSKLTLFILLILLTLFKPSCTTETQTPKEEQNKEKEIVQMNTTDKTQNKPALKHNITQPINIQNKQLQLPVPYSIIPPKPVSQSTDSASTKVETPVPKISTPPLLPIEMPVKRNLKSTCYGIYLSNLNACVPPECPQAYSWNSSSLTCQPPKIVCKSNLIWNGTSCIHPVLISDPLQIPTDFILQANGIMCPDNQMRCNKPVCPKGFVWLERSCVPIKAGEQCPEGNMYYNFCMPNYIAEITIKEACGQSNRYGCAEVSNAIKYPNPQAQKSTLTSQQTTQQQLSNPVPLSIQSLIPSGSQINQSQKLSSVQTITPSMNLYKQINYPVSVPIASPVFRPSPISVPSISTFLSNSPVVTYQSSNIDYTVPGIVTPIVKTMLPPSYVPLPAPRYVF